MYADCDGRCADCPCSWCLGAPTHLPNRAADRSRWRRQARDDLADLGDLYGLTHTSC